MNEAEITIRRAEPGDLAPIFAIYNHEVSSETSTFDTEPRVLGRDDGWLTGREDRYPVLVAKIGDALAGWGSLSQWSPRGAVYVDRPMRGRGVGRALLAELIEIAPAGGIAVLLARIAGENPASVALHERLGFSHIGTQRRAGEKFGRVLDVELLDLHLDGAGR
jgi:L-amino acid N-acyltransferase YncA